MSIVKKIVKANSKDKSLAGNAWYSNHVARPISLYLTKPFMSWHPNTICLIMIIVGLISIPFFIVGSYWSILLGAIILQIHYILDHVDGNVARLANKRSWRGKYLDFIANITVNPLVIIALGIGLFDSSNNMLYLFLGFSGGFFYLALEPARLFKYLMFQELKIEVKTKAQGDESFKAKINKYLNIFFNFPGIMNLIFLFALFNLTSILVIVYGTLFPLLFVLRVTYEFYAWKKRQGKK